MEVKSIGCTVKHVRLVDHPLSMCVVKTINMAQSHVLIHWMTSPRGASRRSVDGEDHSGQEMHEWVQSTMAALLVEDVLTQETISKMLAGTMAWDACPYLAPGRLNGVGVGAISSNKFVGVHHSGVLVVAVGNLGNAIVGWPAVSLDGRPSTHIGCNPREEGGSITVLSRCLVTRKQGLGDLQHGHLIRVAPGNSANDPEAFNTVPPVVLPLAEFGLVDLHDHSRSSNGLAVVNEVNLDNLSAEVAPVTYSCTAMA
mmetsp:Transcript_27412/g.43150  ORF Transcript_27412/g.43150 Transcript_27412/m.43150 type:complete len:256 (-) Transcript_27412:604-1371(-)